MLPSSQANLAAAIEAATGTKTPLAVYFSTNDAKSKLFEEKLLTDPAVGDAWTKVTFFKIVFDKKSDEAKKFRVTRGPALLILDCRKPEKFLRLRRVGVPHRAGERPLGHGRR